MGTVAPVIVLLHSPNLGPGSWRPVADELSRAGWPVRELPGEHLHMLVSPAEVAAAITSLAAEARATGASLRSLP